MRKAVIITNPAAARYREAGLLDARARLAAGGVASDIERTDGPGHAERIARAAVADGADLLIAHGGDGTVMEVATALVGSGKPLGLLPAGTGNLLAGNLHIKRTARAAADTIVRGQERRIDVGRIRTSSGERYFTVAAGAGFDAELMHRTARGHKRLFGVGAYVATAIGLATTLSRATVTIKTEQLSLETRAATVLIANCREIIPGILPLGPNIAPDDGMLDVVILDARSFPSAAMIAWRLLARRPDHHAGITYLRARSVELTADGPVPAQADGEACGTAPMSISIIPAGLTVLAPSPA